MVKYVYVAVTLCTLIREIVSNFVSYYDGFLVLSTVCENLAATYIQGHQLSCNWTTFSP
jgi:hypothetical protein